MFLRLSLREDDLEHKEEDHHRYAACDEGHKDVIDCRRHICCRNGHPQVIETVADQGDRNPYDKIPHRLICHVAVALKRDVPLQREVDALCHKRTNLIADKVSDPAADHHGSRLIIKDIVSQQAPCKLYAEEIHMYLRPHKLCARQPFPEYSRKEGEKKILDDRHSHAEHEEIKDLIQPFRQFRMLRLELSPGLRPARVRRLLSVLYFYFCVRIFCICHVLSWTLLLC